MTGRMLFVAPSAYLLSGLATWMDYLEPGLGEKGWDVIVGLVEGPLHHRPLEYLRIHPHRKWIPIRCNSGTSAGRRRAVIEALEKVRPDLIAGINIPDVYGAAAHLRSKGGSSARVAMTVHGIEAWLYDDIRSQLPWLDGVVCSNRLACRLAATNAGLSGDRIFYAPCGVSPRNLRLDLFASGKLRIGYVGRLEHWQKRVGSIPDILNKLTALNIPFELVVAGSGPEEDNLRQQLKIWIDTGQVRFLGRLNHLEVQEKVYSKIDVLLMPSFWETGPIVIWEAMACGIPVVASRYIGSGIEGALEDGENALLFSLGDTEGAARQLARLWREPGLGKRLGSRGRELVNRRYSREVSINEWHSAFRTILDLPPLPIVPPQSVASAGRLDRWLGTEVAELVREVSGRSRPATDPGGEWPHSLSRTPLNDPGFWDKATHTDFNLDTTEENQA